METKACYDTTALTVAYKSEGSVPMHHSGVEFIAFTDINGTYRRVNLEEIRKFFAEPRMIYGQDYITGLKNILETKDPWKHRSEGMRCKTCMWFVPKETSHKLGVPQWDVGRCRRHSPTMNGYPVCFVNDWCGDHKLDEMKV